MTEQNDTKAKAGAIIVPVTLFEQNCTIIWDEPSKKAVVIDPGGDVPKILDAIKQTGVTVEKIWLTHGHIDHVGGAADLRDALKVPIEGPHEADKFLLDNVVELKSTIADAMPVFSRKQSAKFAATLNSPPLT